MHPVLKKLLFKNQSPVLLLSAPPEFKPIAADLGVPIHTSPKTHYSFVLAFKADIHRDTGNAALQKHGFEGVSLIAIDDDWSAMRFKVQS